MFKKYWDSQKHCGCWVRNSPIHEKQTQKIIYNYRIDLAYTNTILQCLFKPVLGKTHGIGSMIARLSLASLLIPNLNKGPPHVNMIDAKYTAAWPGHNIPLTNFILTLFHLEKYLF